MAERVPRFVIAYKRQAMALLLAMDGDEARPTARLMLDMSARNVYVGTQAELARAAHCSTKFAGKALRLLCGRDFRRRTDGDAGSGRLDVPLAVHPHENVYVVSPALVRSVGKAATLRLRDEYVNVYGGELDGADPLWDAFVRVYRDPAEKLLATVTPTALRVAAFLALSMDRNNTVSASVQGICESLFPSEGDGGGRHPAASRVGAALRELRGRGSGRGQGLDAPILALVRDGSTRAKSGVGKGDCVVHDYVVNPLYVASFDETSRTEVERSFERHLWLDEPGKVREVVSDEKPIDWSGGTARLERVTAGPGAGKTRLLAVTAARLLAEGSDVTCISYTNVAKDELAARIAQHYADGEVRGQLRCMTIHMFILEHVVNRFPREAVAELELSFGADVGPALADATDKDDYAFHAGPGGGSTDVERYHAEARSYAQRLKARNRVAARAVNDGRPTPAMQERQESWAKRELGPDDLLWLGERLLAGAKRKASYPARLGEGLVEGPAERAKVVAMDHPYLLVDEFQDTTPSQAAVISALGRAGSRVCVVGDPAQAIFGFAGASPTLFSGLSARRWGNGGKTGRLTRERVIGANHRSSGRITRLANALRGDRLRQESTGEPGEPVTIVTVTGGAVAAGVARRAVEAGWTVITRTWAHAFGDLPDVSASQAGRIDAATRGSGGGGSLLEKMADASYVGATWRLIHDLWHADTDDECQRALRDFATSCLAADDAGLLTGGDHDVAGGNDGDTKRALGLRDRWVGDDGVCDEATLRDVARRLRELIGECPDDLALAVGVSGEALMRARARISVGTLADVQWRAARSLLVHFLVPDEPRVCTSHYAKGQEWERVLVDIRPTRGDGETVAGAFMNPSAGVRWNRSELPNVLYVACTRARSRLCILVDGSDPGSPRERSQAEVVHEVLGRVGVEAHDPGLFRSVTPDELTEGFWERGWGPGGDVRRHL